MTKIRYALLWALCLVTVSLCCVPCAAISTKVHAYYYPWYHNIATDGDWRHWEDSTHTVPDNIAAAFYPLLGSYSSNDPVAIHQHMKWLFDAGVGVIVTSWWGQGSDENYSTNQLLDIASLYGIKVCFHMEPYGTRTTASVVADIQYIINSYESKPAFFRDPGMGNRPVFYFFASNDTSDSQWAPAFDSIRGTAYDSIVIGDTFDHTRVLNGHWDGFYNYFPGINMTSWNSHANWAKNNNKIFVPPVGPGWDSSQVSPNGPATILRNRGQYYDSTWSLASTAAKTYTSVRYIGITSFNEWHEGHQIEPAVPKTTPSRAYPDYLPDIPTMYIDKTASWAAVYDAAASGKIQCEDYSGGTSAQEGVDYHDTSSENSGGVYRTQGVDIENCSEGGYNIGWITAGEWMRYTNVQISQSGMQEIRIRGASWNSPTIVRVCDGSLSNVIQTITIPVIGAFQNWQTVSGLVSITAGSHTIYLYAESGDFNLNWFEIRPVIFSPNLPYNPGSASITTNSIRWTWTDGSLNETGFNIYANSGTANPTTLQATVPPDTAYWDYTNLTPNTQYSFQTAAVNTAGESSKTSKYTRCTLALPPTINENIICNKSVGVWYPAGTSFAFSSVRGFGLNTHGGNPYKVSYFAFVWDKNPTHTFDSSEQVWNSGYLTQLLTPEDGSYYLHLQSWNAEQVRCPTTLDYGPFNYDSVTLVSIASLPEGVYSAGRTVSLTSSEPGKIYYTTNGSTPTTGSSVYSAPITLNADTTLRFFAVDTAGNQESPKQQIVYTILANNGSIQSVKQLGEATPVRLGNKALYLKQGAFGYIEEPNRLAGIRIQGTINADEGQLVSFTGIMRKPVGAEPYIEISKLTPQGPGSVKPFGVNNRAFKESTLLGLYVRTWGTVKIGSVTTNSFIITDGSDEAGIKVITLGSPGVSGGEFVLVDGAAGHDGARVIYRK